MQKFTKKVFNTLCKALEEKGAILLHYEPENKYARYELNGRIQVVGSR
jgi:hypothetical protein